MCWKCGERMLVNYIELLKKGKPRFAAILDNEIKAYSNTITAATEQ